MFEYILEIAVLICFLKIVYCKTYRKTYLREHSFWLDQKETPALGGERAGLSMSCMCNNTRYIVLKFCIYQLVAWFVYEAFHINHLNCSYHWFYSLNSSPTFRGKKNWKWKIKDSNDKDYPLRMTYTQEAICKFSLCMNGLNFMEICKDFLLVWSSFRLFY